MPATWQTSCVSSILIFVFQICGNVFHFNETSMLLRIGTGCARRVCRTKGARLRSSDHFVLCQRLRSTIGLTMNSNPRSRTPRIGRTPGQLRFVRSEAIGSSAHICFLAQSRRCRRSPRLLLPAVKRTSRFQATTPFIVHSEHDRTVYSMTPSDDEVLQAGGEQIPTARQALQFV